MNTNNAIEIRGLVKNYPAFQLGPLDLTVPRGAIYGLIGPNGAGKTTAIDLIFGMGKNDAGEIRVLGLGHRRDEVAVKRRAAYVSPDLNFQVWGKVGKAIRFVRGFYPDWDDAYCAELMRAFHLSDDEKIATLSFGARTKLSLLLALSRRPEILILDEPTTGLDAVSKQQVFGELLKAVEDGERTVLISSHGLSDIERFADHVGMIKNGKLLLAGRMDEIVDRFRFVEFFSDHGMTFENHPGLTILRRAEQNTQSAADLQSAGTGACFPAISADCKSAAHSRAETRWLALLDQSSDARNFLQSRGAKEISLTRVTLEDLFVALAKEEEEK